MYKAIKSSKITGDNGKVYEIAVDVDGEDNDEYQEETYTIDYNNVKTEEEIILQAAKKYTIKSSKISNDSEICPGTILIFASSISKNDIQGLS